SVNLPLSEFFETPQNADVLPKDKDLVVFCRAGGRSLHASRVLLEKGFNVFNLEGGLLALNQELPAQKKIKIKEH
ncbi:MAG: rhodanese-like domain-containing protein, partial [Candidatus Diapherotrites archaeon]|nr:rhodanese-like domain-containing protein [Candidatus Diapherotrites archaeon]